MHCFVGTVCYRGTRLLILWHVTSIKRKLFSENVSPLSTRIMVSGFKWSLQLRWYIAWHATKHQNKTLHTYMNEIYSQNKFVHTCVILYLYIWVRRNSAVCKVISQKRNLKGITPWDHPNIAGKHPYLKTLFIPLIYNKNKAWKERGPSATEMELKQRNNLWKNIDVYYHKNNYWNSDITTEKCISLEYDK